jgi:ribosomal protein S12 methylthiotransferase accessory factor YcaO
MKHHVYRVEIRDQRAEGGSYVVLIRRSSFPDVGPSCVGVGAGRRDPKAAIASAMREVRYRRRAGQFR